MLKKSSLPRGRLGWNARPFLAGLSTQAFPMIYVPFKNGNRHHTPTAAIYWSEFHATCIKSFQYWYHSITLTMRAEEAKEGGEGRGDDEFERPDLQFSQLVLNARTLSAKKSGMFYIKVLNNHCPCPCPILRPGLLNTTVAWKCCSIIYNAMLPMRSQKLFVYQGNDVVSPLASSHYQSRNMLGRTAITTYNLSL